MGLVALRVDRLMTMLRDVLVVTVPVAAAVLLAYQVSLYEQSKRAEIMAGVVLNRAALTTNQLASVFERMAGFDSAHACSPEAVTMMRQIDLGSSLLQGVGYVENDRLLCSSLGAADPVEVGPADYVSATDTAFRRQRILSIAPDAPLLLVSARSGYTGLIHPALIFSLSDEGKDLPAGVVSYSTRQLIISSDSNAFDWSSAAMPDGDYAGTLTMGDELLAWQRSPRWDHFTYAAIPLAAVTEGFVSLSQLLVPLGIIVGLVVLLVLRRLAASRTSLPALLKAGIARKEVFTVYQPIVDMRTGRWVGAEVLARWRRPSGEMISPDVFVPIAEKHGLIRQLTRHVMMSSAEDLAGFVNMAPDFFVSVNITSMDLQDPAFSAQLLAECATRGIAHHRIHLEITERAEIDPASQAQIIRQLRDEGFEIGIDDFGIGYSNLAYLDTLNVDYLKIDKAFVAGISNGAIGTAVVDHIIELGAGRGLKLIAEGVEEEEQRAALVARGVWLGQGWLFGKPMPAADLTAGYLTLLRGMTEPKPLARVA